MECEFERWIGAASTVIWTLYRTVVVKKSWAQLAKLPSTATASTSHSMIQP